jgi:hypothetical protein
MEVQRGFFNPAADDSLTKTLKSKIGNKTVIEANDLYSIVAAHCGWDLTQTEAAHFRAIMESTKLMKASALEDDKFMAEYFDYKLTITGPGKSNKTIGSGKHIINAYGIKHGHFLVVAKELLTDVEFYDFDSLHLPSKVKERLNNPDFSALGLAGVSDKPQSTLPHQNTTAILDTATVLAPTTRPSNEVDMECNRNLNSNSSNTATTHKNSVVDLLSLDEETDAQNSLLEILLGTKAGKESVNKLMSSAFMNRNSVLRVTSKEEIKLTSWDRAEFDKFRDQVLAEKTFDGCLTDMIPHRLLKVLAISWNLDKTKDLNLKSILTLIEGDTDEALRVISERLHTRDGTADLQLLSVAVSTDSNGDPKAQDWLEKAHVALERTSDQYNTKDKNRALMGGVSINYPSIKRDFDNRHGSGWCTMDSELLIDRISKALADIKRSNDAERFNQHKPRVWKKATEYKQHIDFSTRKKNVNFEEEKETSNQFKKSAVEKLLNSAAKPDSSPSANDGAATEKPKPRVSKKMKEEEAKSTKFCKFCRTTGEHYWPDCPTCDESALFYPDLIKIYKDYHEEKKADSLDAANKKRNLENGKDRADAKK